MNRVQSGRQGELFSITVSLLVVAAMIVGAIGAPFFVRAQSGEDINDEVFCFIDGEFQDIGNPLHPLFGTECESDEQPQCNDGIDNDDDDLTDLDDPGCESASDNDETDPAPSVFQCNDGIDNDEDGKTDWDAIPGVGDAGCLTPLDDNEGDDPAPDPETPENTALLCADGLDNDEDEAVDLSDSDCSTFKPVLLIKKVVINDNGGTGTTSDFSFSVNGGATTTFSVTGEDSMTFSATGTYSVLETATSSYTVSYDGCSGDLTVGATSTCTITNNDTAPESTGGGGSGGAPADCAGDLDNDNDGQTDMNDPGCENSSDDDESTVVSSTSSGGGGGGGGGGGIISGPLSLGAGGGPIVPATPTVLGTTTAIVVEDCGQYINSFIKFGGSNDPEQVRRLQQFLNLYEGGTLAENGVYDEPTIAAVEAFQLKYASDVLTPWGIQNPTGHVYLTTRKKINELYCAGTNQFPLTPLQEQEIENYREGRGRGGQVGGAQTSVQEDTDSEIQVSTPPVESETTEEDTDEGEMEEDTDEGPGFFGRLWRGLVNIF